MSNSNNDWLEDFRKKQEAEKKIKKDVTKKIINALKGVDRVSCIPEILANIFESMQDENDDVVINGFNNHIVKWGIETYAGRKLCKVAKKILSVYEYCVEKKYTEDNKWEWRSGDREVCYIPNDTKKILYFLNQNIRFVVVLDKYDMHVREVYKSIYDEEYFYSYKDTGFKSVTELKEGLKTENGLEIALCNLTGKYTKFANSIEGNQYPNRIDLETMKKTNFDKPCEAFAYGDNRDSGYLMSINTLTSDIAGDKCELKDLSWADYAFHDMREVINSIPKSFLKKINRDESIKDILK